MKRLLPYLDAAYNLARWLMQDERIAEDIAQETYMRAFPYFTDFRRSGGRSRLLTMVRNRCYECLGEKDAPFEEVRNTGQEPANRRASVKDAVAELPPELREVLVLRELEKLSYKEIATITAIPSEAVMARLSRARQRLQQDLPFQVEPEKTYLQDRIFGRRQLRIG